MRRIALLLLLTFGGLLGIRAQEPALVLTRDAAVENTLDATTLARVYFFVGTEGEVVRLTAQGTDNFGVSLLLTTLDGAVFGQAAPNSDRVTILPDITLPATASYYVTAFASGVAIEGAFSLLLENASPTPEVTPEVTVEVTSEVAVTPAPTAQFGVAPTTQAPGGAVANAYETPTQILLPNGIQVALAWNANVDLNLEVRDPLGNTLYFDSRTSTIGGAFGFDANGLCAVISPNPTETATWTPGFLPTGSYEILVFYRQACETPDPVSFTLSVSVNGQPLTQQEGTLNAPVQNANSVYVSSFRINTDATGIMNAGNTYPDSALNVLAAPIDAASAVALAPDVPLTGAITSNAYYQAFALDVVANDLLSLGVNATAGSLDTLLQVSDVNGNLIGVNDDSNSTRNSSLPNFRFATAGTYYVIVTRYGKEIGGSEGTFQLTATRGFAQLPAEVLALNAPAGEIQIALTWATNADVQLLVRDPIGDSVFDDQPTVSSGGTLALQGNLNCVRAAGTPASYVYWPQGFLRAGNYEIDVWFQSACNDVTPVEATLSIVVRGQIITVETIRPALDQHYVIGLTINSDGTAVARQGGFQSNDAATLQWQSDTPILIAPNVPVAGQISDGNVFDTYVFDGTAGQGITIVNAATSPTLDTKLFLIGPSGLQVTDNDDSGSSSPTVRRSDAVIANYVLPQNGRYTIIATRYATIYGGTVGSYSLTLAAN